MIFRRGYSAWEIEDAQERHKLTFPPDLLDYYSRRRRVTAKGYDWTYDHEVIVSMLKWPLEGFLFELREDDLWIEAWGSRPESLSEREKCLTTLVESAPKLIPLTGHRYLCEEPRAPGNPVLSVHQSDIIYYASSLREFLKRNGKYAALNKTPDKIAFWSDVIHAD